MARPLRLEYPGAVYHVTARGNAKQAIYLDDEDRARFLGLLAREVGQQGWRCTAYCLMDNHYHLLFETPEPNLVAGMKRLNGAYAQAFNRRHGRVGHLLQGRYTAILVDRDSHLLELCRYVVLNPVRAGLVERPADWRWSSYQATARARTDRSRAAPAWLDVAWVLEQFGRTPTAARRAYRHFVAEGVVAASPWQDLRGGIWLGPEGFRQRMQERLSKAAMANVPVAQRQPTRPRAEEVLEAVAAAYDLSRDDLLRRRDPAAFRAAVYLLRRAANLSIKEVAGLFGISQPWVSRIQGGIERGDGVRGLRPLLRRFDQPIAPKPPRVMDRDALS
jgi:REP element-mobilizing transposase RayT